MTQHSASTNRLYRSLLLMLFLSPAAAVGQDEGNGIAVYFPTNVATLSAAAQKTLDSLIYRGVIHTGHRITITGYADEPGTAALNNSLSQRRAQAVADYLTRDGFLRKGSITAVVGRGYDASAAGRGDNPRYRRTSIAVSDEPPLPIRPKPVLPGTPRPASPPSPVARLDTMRANTTLALDAVLFENNSDVVLPSSIGQLKELLKALRENPAVRIRLEGHVCCGGEPVHAQHISDIRAKAVYDYLVRNGIVRERMTYQGFGFSRPLIQPEVTEDDQRLNRRVEVRILSN